mmetsp:Transcript_9805/g.32811  ORF Transcript_9805/g.32811 Transcript_9805/m.32811 type:complete len:83 (-) Transcript_9805:1249-1497(-)
MVQQAVAGGCISPVYVMTMIDTVGASAFMTYCGMKSGLLESMKTAMPAESMWPPKTFLGCPKGEVGVENKIRATAEKEVTSA